MKQLQEHDPETYHHSLRVAELALLLTKELDLSSIEQQTIYKGALLHDIGKLGIPIEVLNREQKLTTEEWLLIQEHTILGYQLTRKYFDMLVVPYIILFHHERYNGTGYPFGVVDQQIPLGAKIVGVVDSFDAMTFQRPYNRAKSREDALIELEKQKGILYSSDLISAFTDLINRELDRRAKKSRQ